MTKPKIPMPDLADLMYTPRTTVHQMVSKPEIQPVLPEHAINGMTRNFNERQAMLMMVAGDLVRGGFKFPLAAQWSCRIAETLLFDPEASCVHVEFRRNGAMFFFTSPDAPEAADAAGPARFRMTFELHAYRTAIRAAMGADGEQAA